MRHATPAWLPCPADRLFRVWPTPSWSQVRCLPIRLDGGTAPAAWPKTLVLAPRASSRRSMILRHGRIVPGCPEIGFRRSHPFAIPADTHRPVANIPWRSAMTSADAVLEVRLRSGLSWEMLSELFNVSHRTLQHWANGKAPSARREQEIRRTLDSVRHLDEGDRRATRDRLLATTNGPSLFALLVERRFVDVMRLPKGAAPKDRKRRTTRLSEDEWAMRQPPPPFVLLDTISGELEIPVGRSRIVRPAR